VVLVKNLKNAVSIKNDNRRTTRLLQRSAKNARPLKSDVMVLITSMKRYVAYILIIIGFAFPIYVDIISGNMIEELKISQDMYKSPEGMKVIISFIEAKISETSFKAISFSVFVFLIGMGIIILLTERIRELKKRIESLENSLYNKP
jgi:hypothetical protein